jgi:predicted ATP-grasp superfamily ATP-dependent carboligase
MVTRSRWYRPLAELGASELHEESLGSGLERLNVERMVLLPCSDAWAMAVSELKPELAKRFPSSVAAPEVLLQLVDKALLAKVLVRMDLPHPRTMLLDGPEALEAVPDEQLKGFFLKPNRSMEFFQAYGVKALRFRDREDAARLFKDAFAKGFALMLQEFIPGAPSRHVFVEGFMDRNGRICGTFARRRIRMYPEDFGNSTSCLSIPLTEVSGAVETLCSLLSGIRYRGVFSAEFKLDGRDGRFKLLEVNARPWWYVDFAAVCGVDVCGMAYHDSLGEGVKPVPGYRVGRRCVYPLLDLRSWFGERGVHTLSVWSLMRSWVGARRPVHCWEDPMPGTVEFLLWMKNKVLEGLGR